MQEEGSELIIVYGSVADKDVDAVLHLLPENATYIFTQAQSKRALAAEKIAQKFSDFCHQTGRVEKEIYVKSDVAGAVVFALETAARLVSEKPESRPVIYIGGSTYVVSEAVVMF